MMKIDGRDRAECQNWEMKGRNGHYGILFKSLKDKTWNSAFSPTKISKKKKKRVRADIDVQ